VYVPYVDSVHTFRTEVVIVSNSSPRQSSKFSMTVIDFYSNVCFALPAIALQY